MYRIATILSTELYSKPHCYSGYRTNLASGLSRELVRQELFYRSQHIAFLDLAFPQRQDFPTSLFKRAGVRLIALDIPVEFFIPVGVVRGWTVGMAASRVLMPKAPMNEDRHTLTRKYEVRLAGEVGSVKAKAVARSMKEPANFHLRRGVF